MIRCATFPPISFEGRQAGMNFAELIGAIHHHRGARRNTTRISTDFKNRCTMRNNTHVRSRSRLGQLHQLVVQAATRRIPARLRPGTRLDQRLHNLFFARAKRPLNAHQGLGQTT